MVRWRVAALKARSLNSGRGGVLQDEARNVHVTAASRDSAHSSSCYTVRPQANSSFPNSFCQHVASSGTSMLAASCG